MSETKQNPASPDGKLPLYADAACIAQNLGAIDKAVAAITDDEQRREVASHLAFLHANLYAVYYDTLPKGPNGRHWPRPDADAKLAEIRPDIFACDVRHDGVIRIIDLCYTAFMRAKEEHGNPDDNGPFDWFNDTYLSMVEKITEWAAQYRSITERAASLEKTASEALQECERLRATLKALYASRRTPGADK